MVITVHEVSLPAAPDDLPVGEEVFYGKLHQAHPKKAEQ